MTDLVASHNVLPFRPVSSRQRLHGLDWLRAFATLAVVMLHAGIPYMSHTLPGLVWASYSPVGSDYLDVLCWSINGCIMPLFFLMSGYFAADLFKKQGADGFLWHRIKRLGGPYLFGVVFVLPLSTYVWLTGWITAGLAPLKVYRSLKVEQSLKDAVLGSAHLWYLLYLIIFCAGMWALSKLARPARRTSLSVERLTIRDGQRGPSFARMWACIGVVSGIAVMCVSLFFYPRIVIGFRNSMFPLPANLAYYAVPFLFGWFWNSFPVSSVTKPNRKWFGMFAGACVVFALLWPHLTTHLEGDSASVQNAAVPILFVTFAMTMSTSLFGLTLNWNAPTPPKPIQYCAKASLWVYLFHHPVVALTQLTMLDWNMAVEIKFAIVTSLSMGLCLASYEVLGRRTWAAVVLQGRRDVPQIQDREIPQEIRRAA